MMRGRRTELPTVAQRERIEWATTRLDEAINQLRQEPDSRLRVVVVLSRHAELETARHMAALQQSA